MVDRESHMITALVLTLGQDFWREASKAFARQDPGIPNEEGVRKQGIVKKSGSLHQASDFLSVADRRHVSKQP